MQKIVKNQRKYEAEALELYGFKLDEGDHRKPELVIEECYLDFETKSLQEA